MQFKTGGEKPSSNWLALQTLGGCRSPSASSHKPFDAPRKRQKLSHVPHTNLQPPLAISLPSSSSITIENGGEDLQRSCKGESLDTLRKMVLGRLHYTAEQQQPGKYLAIDCEMVGVGIDGSESSLARVSLINYHGVVQLDEFVKQREKVVDYRTQFSGVRDVDMIKARPFEEVQQRVSELLEDRIVIGHAIHNDLKALLLSHPRTHLRDTQVLAGKSKLVRSKYIALRNLVKQELGLTIQSGEHSSVTDARASMAIYRLHRNKWEKELVKMTSSKKSRNKSRKIHENEQDTLGKLREKEKILNGGNAIKNGSMSKAEWWRELGS